VSTNSLPEVDRKAPRLPKKPTGSARAGTSKWFTDIIEAVRKPISFFVLVALIVALGLLVSRLIDREPVFWGLLVLLALLLILFTYLVMKHPDELMGRPRPLPSPPVPPAPAILDTRKPPSGVSPGTVDLVLRLNEDIYGAQSNPPELDKWYRNLQPVLHQAPFYSIPTYFLDRDLYILDYNVAFEIVFAASAGNLRGRHVNWFIAQLHNHAEVHEHGRQFTERVEREKHFPLVDFEPIIYNSDIFGQVEFVKIASQLHDTEGKLQGWSVALMPKRIKWDLFEKKLASKMRQDKLWSVYSATYDRILTSFPPYNALIADVIGVIQGDNCLIADLGAGTGNVTAAILDAKRGHRIVAIENNVGMLDRLRMKNLPVTILKDSIENCERLKEGIFDAVVMVNVLYAVDDPLKCLKQIHRLLKPNGVLGFSTTHRETNLDELLDAIRTHLTAGSPDDHWQDDYRALEKVNREIEASIARRFTREEYEKFVRLAGFEVTHYIPSTYHNAVLVMHAKKKGDRPSA
jgi:SAM-dependent methyltransferase